MTPSLTISGIALCRASCYAERAASAAWIRSRPDLARRLLQPSNQLASQPAPVDVFPYSDRIVDLASVDWKRVSDGPSPILIEITHPWPPNEVNALDPATWQLELLIAGDNIRAARSFVTVTFDGTWPDQESRAIWEHFLVYGPSPEIWHPPEDEIRLNEVHA